MSTSEFMMSVLNRRNGTAPPSAAILGGGGAGVSPGLGPTVSAQYLLPSGAQGSPGSGPQQIVIASNVELDKLSPLQSPSRSATSEWR
jgi:hypothetical protein